MHTDPKSHELSVYLPHSIRDFLKQEMKEIPETYAVRIMMTTNFRAKLRFFYLNYMNSNSAYTDEG